jgi:hypothetical protein
VPYLLLGLQGVQWAVGNSRGARKLARTPHVNPKKKCKKEKTIHQLYFQVQIVYQLPSEFAFNLLQGGLLFRVKNNVQLQ